MTRFCLFITSLWVASTTFGSTTKQQAITEAQKTPVGPFGEVIPGVITTLKTQEPVIALTLDACGGQGPHSYDQDMIQFLEKQEVKATIFISGRWLKYHEAKAKMLAGNPLFTIENHGLHHKPASSNGRSAFGIKGTQNLHHLYREIKGNHDYIERITGTKTKYYRPGTGYIDQRALKLAEELDHKVIGFNIISGDVLYPGDKAQIKARLDQATAGAIVIIHLNHADWQGFEALKEWVIQKKNQGYRFVHLDEFPLQ